MKLKAASLCAVLLLTGCLTPCNGSETDRENGKRAAICGDQELVVDNRLYIGDTPVNITIAAGPRPTDRIIANSLRILIHDYFGYQVEVMNYEYNLQQWVERMDCSVDDGEDCFNIPMIHIGVVETTDLYTNYTGQVRDAGYLGFNVKLGWFISASEVDDATIGASPDHYKYFTNATLAEKYSLSRALVDGLTKKVASQSARWCDKKRFEKCDSSGQFIPSWCKGHDKCATLIAGFPHENYKQVTDQIEKLGLFVKVAWIGTKFEGHVSRSVVRDQPVLFFDYSISPMTESTETFTEVLFPSCDTVGQIEGCIYQNAKLRKLYWKYLEDAAPSIVKLIRNANFLSEDYLKVVKDKVSQLYDEDSLVKYACSLVQRELFQKWSLGVRSQHELISDINN